MTLTGMAFNYRKSVEWVIKAYSDAGVSFPNGFQKDAIQNSVGAHKGTKWKNWTCDISVVTNDHGTFIVVEDSGTCGLTGSNTDIREVNKKLARGGNLNENERLSRFRSMFSSGGNSGPGLYGAGKSVYAVASKTYTYYFDSLREDGLYIADINKMGQVNPIAYEGAAAKEYILSNTGLPEKTLSGTRVIITDPKDELVDSIINGDIITDILESWWIIIQRLGEGSCISVQGVPVNVPSNIKNTRFKHEIGRPEIYSPGYKVKHFGLFFFPDGSNIWNGISYYRKGMKIGDVDIRDIPAKVDGKFWGYVEVDGQWEDLLSDIEDNVHFGVSAFKKRTTTYQNLKNYCNTKFAACMIEWGFRKDRESEDKKLNDELQNIAEELQGLFDNLGFEDLGRGAKRPDFDIRLQDIQYPANGTEEVTSGDEIQFSVRINNSFLSDKKFDYKLTVLNPQTGDVVSHIDHGQVSIKSGLAEKLDFVHKVTRENSERFAENRIKLIVKAVGSNGEKSRELPFFYDIDKPDNSRDSVNLYLHECIFPRQQSRRVDYDESITNVSYRIENKRNSPLRYRLNISIHNASVSNCPKITDVASLEGSLSPYEEDITPSIDKIVFDKDTYAPHLASGVLELRARLIALEDDDDFESGDRITFYHYKIFLNEDEKSGHHDSFKPRSTDAPDDYRRSWCTPGSNRAIYINVGHTAYLNVADNPEVQREYLHEQMLKQYTLLYLAEGKTDMFAEAGEDFSTLDAQDVVERVINKIESIYNQSLRG